MCHNFIVELNSIYYFCKIPFIMFVKKLFQSFFQSVVSRYLILHCLLWVVINSFMRSNKNFRWYERRKISIRIFFEISCFITIRRIIIFQKNVTEQQVIVEKRDYKKLWKYCITMARFFVRLTNIKVLKLLFDRDMLRERPFRDRDVSITFF